MAHQNMRRSMRLKFPKSTWLLCMDVCTLRNWVTHRYKDDGPCTNKRTGTRMPISFCAYNSPFGLLSIRDRCTRLSVSGYFQYSLHNPIFATPLRSMHNTFSATGISPHCPLEILVINRPEWLAAEKLNKKNIPGYGALNCT
jgi:hypothetical protein